MKDYSKFQFLHFFRYLGDALFYAFLTIYFKSLNFSDLELGTLLAVIPLTAIIGSLVLSKLSGNQHRNIIMLKVVNVVEAIFMIFFGFFASFVPILIFDIIVAFCNKAYYSLLESIAIDVSKSANKNYSNIRIFGSIAYLISSFFGGYLIEFFNYKYVFIIASCLYLISNLFILFIKSDKNDNVIEKDSVKIVDIFKNKSFCFYLLFYVFALGASNVSDNIFALYVSDLGMNQANYGMVFSMEVLFEIICMFIVSKVIKKDKYKLVLICSAILICLRNVLFAIPMPLIALAIIASLRGIAWGSMLAVHLNYFSSIVKKEYLTKSIFALNIFLQIFNALFNQFGPKISSYSYSLMFSLLALFSIIGLIMLIFVKQSNLDTNCDKLITEQNNLEG